MVCLSFEQTVLKKNGKIGGKNLVGEGGVVYSQKPSGGVSVVFRYLLSLRPRGPQTRWRRRAGHLLSTHARLGYQRRLDQVSAPRGRVATARAFSVTGQATGDPDALCFFVRFSRPGRVRLRFQPACVRACVCAST